MQDNHTTQQQKACTKCGEILPATLEFFYADKQKRDGLRPSCKSCANVTISRWQEENPDKVAGYKRAYAKANREKANEKVRAYAKANREKVAERNRAWRRANPGKRREFNHRRRSLERNAPGSHTATDIQALYAAQDGRCAYCGKEVGDDYHVDHVVPLSRGGSNWPDNLVIACPPCNFAKSYKLPEEWRTA